MAKDKAMIKIIFLFAILLSGCGEVEEELDTTGELSTNYFCVNNNVYRVDQFETYTSSELLSNEDTGEFYDCNATVNYSDFTWLSI